MHRLKLVNDACHWYMSELGARVVAESGRAEDRHHLGKLMLMSLRDNPHLVLQIDGGTGQSETSGSVLERSVRCAGAFRKLGLRLGDVVVLMAPNHLDLAIPFYAGLYTGVAIASIDRLLQIKELEDIFIKDEPKIVFCQSARAKDVRTALDNCNLKGKIVTFDKSSQDVNDSVRFEEFMKDYDSETTVETFKASDFDTEETAAVLLSTSGSTGLPKQATVTHKNFAIGCVYFWSKERQFPTPFKLFLVVSPLQWLTANSIFIISAIFKMPRLQSSVDIDYEHACYLINTYKPTSTILSPTFLANLLKYGAKKCDFTCFQLIAIAGSAVSKELLAEIKSLCPKSEVRDLYGMTEISSGAFFNDCQVQGSSGRPSPHLQYRLIDVDTNEDIVEANVKGELWLKGPSVSKGYYKDPEVTKQAFTEDGWFKTGDIFYRDEHWNFFFVARIKFLLKYMNHQISPAEIENMIKKHPGVQDAVVIGIPDPDCGDLPVACVVRRFSSTVTAQEIKDLVKNNLTDTKQLRGGVVFMDKIPLTSTTKVDVKKLKELVATMELE
ncbi:luciferin 4-monooxygenase-like [Pectinophora gossypiella]|uniref:luciferin 4-monooxygenase-like n=1 Tax=Pectinophora gossypiella TaxID=13191 RepID=UPI00214EA703|nr:luciferin 4-monooxygenase-like [Pectinophora gossypiella]